MITSTSNGKVVLNIHSTQLKAQLNKHFLLGA